MTRRLLPLLLALLLCTACGGKTAPPTATATPTASPTATVCPTTAPSPTATPVPTPQTPEQFVSTQLAGHEQLSRLTNRAVVAQLLLQLEGAMSFGRLDATTLTARVGDYDTLGWTDCNVYVFDFTRQLDAFPRITEQPSELVTFVYWPAADDWAVSYDESSDDSYDFLDQTSSTSTSVRVLHQLSGSAKSLPTVADRHAFFALACQLATYLDGSDWQQLLPAGHLEPLADGGFVGYALVTDAAGAVRMMTMDSRSGTVFPSPDQQLLTAPQLPTRDGVAQGDLVPLIVKNKSLLYGNDANPIFIPTADGFYLYAANGLYRINSRAGTVKCLQRSLAKPPHTDHEDVYTQLRRTANGFMIYNKHGACRLDISGRLLRRVTIPIDDYMEQFWYRYGYSLQYSDDLSLTMLSSDNSYATFFDNNTHRVLTTVMYEGMAFDPATKTLSGKCLWPLRSRLDQSTEPQQWAWVTFDPYSGKEPTCRLIDEPNTETREYIGSDEIETGYCLPYAAQDKVFSPTTPVTLAHYTDGAPDGTVAVSADPFNGGRFTIEELISLDGYCLLRARQTAIRDNACLLALRDGETTATPVLYFPRDDVVTHAISDDGQLLLLDNDAYGDNPYYFIVRPKHSKEVPP